MTRLEQLKKEREDFSNFKCVPFDLKDVLLRNFDREIECEKMRERWNNNDSL